MTWTPYPPATALRVELGGGYTQPLYSRGSNYGLLNQIELLRKAGAVSMQVLMLTPAVGSKLLESTYTSGEVFRSVGGAS